MNNTPATSMADLMKKQTVTARSISRGQTVSGVITKLTPQEIVIDIHAKAPAVVMEQDKSIMKQMLETLHVGDTVSAYVISVEGMTGAPVVSLRKQIADAGWKVLEDALEKKQKVTVIIGQQTKGGYVVSSETGLSGFLPNSYCTSRALTPGSEVSVSIVEITRENHRFVVSQKELFSREEFMKLSKKIKQGQAVSVTVSEVSPNGLAVSVQVAEGETLPGFIRGDEVSWDGYDSSAYTVGQQLQAEITYIDMNNAKIMLSARKLVKDPLAEVFAAFAPDQTVTGTITSMDDRGAIVDLQKDNVTGFIKKENIPADQELTVGKSVQCSVVSVAANERRVYLVPVLTAKPMFYR